jgi:hypothetical protein
MRLYGRLNRFSYGIESTLIALAGLAFAALIVGCQPAAAAQVEPTPLPTYTPLPTHTPLPTFTPVPSPTPTLAPSPTPTATPAPEAIGPESYPENVNPLTGLVVDDPAVLQRRPLLVKISNAPPVVRPQSGTSSADLVFEHYAEGGWTRFTALFYSQGVDHLGSVRSARLIDLELPQMYDAMLVFSGASNGIVEMIRRSDLYPRQVISPQFGYGEPYFVRFPRDGLPFEHTLFSDTAELWRWTDEHEVNRPPRFSTPGMAFRETPPPRGVPASTASMDYARTSVLWQYDPVSGRYLRWTDGIPHNDALTGQQLAFENVVVVRAFHEEIDILPEVFYGVEKSIEIRIWGTGPATLLRDGQMFEGVWYRLNDGDMFTFTDFSGEPLYLKPGRTFFQVARPGFEPLIVQP